MKGGDEKGKRKNINFSKIVYIIVNQIMRLVIFVKFFEKLVILGITIQLRVDFMKKQLIPVDNVDNSANNCFMGFGDEIQLLCKLNKG